LAVDNFFVMTAAFFTGAFLVAMGFLAVPEAAALGLTVLALTGFFAGTGFVVLAAGLGLTAVADFVSAGFFATGFAFWGERKTCNHKGKQQYRTCLFSRIVADSLGCKFDLARGTW